MGDLNPLVGLTYACMHEGILGSTAVDNTISLVLMQL